MIFLPDLFGAGLLADHIDAGNVNLRFHPGLPLGILNYSEKVQFGQLWDEVTMQCRGLIYNTETLQIIARPFEKFYNYGDPHAPMIPLTEPVVVTDKLDGSLGV